MDCIRASQPLLIALRIADGDEKPVMPEIAAAMYLARKKISIALIAERFRKMRVEGTNFNPLILEEFQWDNEWVHLMGNDEVHPKDDLFWSHVDEAIGASESLRAPRITRTYARTRRSVPASTSIIEEEEEEQVSRGEEDDEDHYVADDLDIEDDFGQPPSTPQDCAPRNANESGHGDIEFDVD
ncbi:hypothetical protein GUJ93_ZPchr0002g25060 [Zizania palustris]|uniref:Uncharacterized protein n=1 Tax=Zizania palustris TaxID=103762 RepID=A0A8J5S612_ZIZPA|nr:hypothetical protein GUJ93_ZPchr0002g25060 [Zizania palustris]